MKDQHRKKLRRFEDVAHLHELTFSCVDRKPILTTEHRFKILSDSLSTACVEEQFQLIAFVFMPEHVHLLVLPEHTDRKVGRLLARTKQPASSQIRQTLSLQQQQEFIVQERMNKFCFRMWQTGSGFDRNLFSPDAISASINYIHHNPVRRGLCDRAIDYKWSSARFYLQDIIDPDLPILTRPAPEWFHQSGSQTFIV